jgi:anaphase-promoting complex subunit 1
LANSPRTDISKLDPAAIRVFLSENRSAESVFLNVLIPAANGHKGLFIFHVEQGAPGHYGFSEVRMIECLAAAPVLATRALVYDTLAVDLEGVPWLLTPSSGRLPINIFYVDVEAVANHFATGLKLAVDGVRHVVDLTEASGSNVTAVYDDGQRVRVSAQTWLPEGLCRRAMEALSYALAPDVYAELSEAYLNSAFSVGAHSPSEQWQALADVVLSKCGLGVEAPSTVTTDPTLLRLARRVGRKSKKVAAPQSVGPAACTPEVLLALHLVAQDCRLASTTEPDLLLIAPIISQLASAVGRRDWLDYWARLMPSAIEGASFSSRELMVHPRS